MPFITNLPYTPQRIVSLVPSQTELLFDLGLGDKVVGVTKFCLHPADQVKYKTVVGGTKNFRFEVIDGLNPDLLLGNKEENYKEGIEHLTEKYSVWMSDLYNLPDALAMIRTVGRLAGVSTQANHIAQNIKSRFDQLVPVASAKVAYLIWQKPLMVAGNHTFIDDMLLRCGFVNVFGTLVSYPEITPGQLCAAAPDWIFLSSEPYPFREKHATDFEQMCPGSRVLLVDGEMFSWYGSRLLQSVTYFEQLIRSEMKF